MATTATISQLGQAGIQSVFDMIASYGTDVVLPAAEDVTSVTVDGGDMTITHTGGETLVSFNSDMEIDFLNLRINILSLVNLDNDIPAQANDALIHDGTGFAPTPLSSIVSQATLSTQGYYGMLSNYYFTGGAATTTVIDTDDVGQYVDVNFNLDSNGLFDERPLPMKLANPTGHTGTGTQADPIVFSLEGLDTHGFANFRASMSFVPETDEGQLETRLLFERHSGTTPNDQFPIEEVSISMEQGADIHYPAEPMLSFFVGDTIDTNAPGDAGSCRFQIKSSVEGTLHMRALTWYVNV